MKFKTVQPFICKDSGKLHDLDAVFESDSQERIRELQKKGFIDTVEVKQKVNKKLNSTPTE